MQEKMHLSTTRTTQLLTLPVKAHRLYSVNERADYLAICITSSAFVKVMALTVTEFEERIL